MKRALLTALVGAMLAASALGGTFRVSYTCRGQGRMVTVLAESTAEARRAVKYMFPNCYVTGAHRVSK